MVKKMTLALIFVLFSVKCAIAFDVDSFVPTYTDKKYWTQQMRYEVVPGETVAFTQLRGPCGELPTYSESKGAFKSGKMGIYKKWGALKEMGSMLRSFSKHCQGPTPVMVLGYAASPDAPIGETDTVQLKYKGEPKIRIIFVAPSDQTADTGITKYCLYD